ncbi:hypothetical protein LCGC14_1567410 [marine sediment metagenome]|uniref:dATP/dGTP diphosphohydrolase N-terminal domain-containing protein n=1 Tax=marine sediment metagenome TaxID=412755 RepID=A0A0F9IKM0_9ZZZZ
MNKAEASTQAAMLIKSKRWDQIHKHGWSTEHDDAHASGELANAAAAFATGRGELWPWEEHFNPSGGYLESLTNAGALILAEIERELRATR